MPDNRLFPVNIHRTNEGINKSYPDILLKGRGNKSHSSISLPSPKWERRIPCLQNSRQMKSVHTQRIVRYFPCNLAVFSKVGGTQHLLICRKNDGLFICIYLKNKLYKYLLYRLTLMPTLMCMHVEQP